jgi:choline dehydrogenase-like flavoprotein
VLSDADTVPRGQCLRADVCIVGAGAAGITLAHELERHHTQVLILESGDLAPRVDTQRLYEGRSAGNPYYALDACRFRQLGGSTSQWGGWCRPLDAIDFEKRDWVGHSGWPFARHELQAHYARAQAICDLDRCEYDATTSPDPGTPSLLERAGACFGETILQIRATRFGEAYRTLLRQSSNIHLLLNANVIEIVMDSENRNASSIRAATLSGNRFDVAAKWFVLAMGGIENARLLLASRGRRACGVGNEQDLVGRFFSDHLHVPLGLVRHVSARTSQVYQTQQHRGITIRRGFSLTDGYARRDQRLGFAVTLHNAHDPHDILSLAQTPASYGSMRHLFTSLRSGRWPEQGLHHARIVSESVGEATISIYRKFVKPAPRTLMVGARAEQSPNRDSRVTLDDSHDRLGMPRVRLDWKTSAQDIDNIRACRELFARELRSGITLVPLQQDGGRDWRDLIAGGAHHCGTTRMHPDPNQGVVDEHCRLHGVSNLFVAGSSVFPTTGWAPPTLTIVALAVRLAHRLKSLAA